MKTESSGASFGDVISAAALGIGLLTAWLYVTGWLYSYHYFARFRIPMLMADLPKEHLFVYGGLVVSKNPFLSLLVALAIVGVIGACTSYRRRLKRFGLGTIVVVLVLLVFLLGRLGAIGTAAAEFATQQVTDFDAYPRVRVALADGVPDASLLLADIADTDCGRLVLATPDRLFLIRPVAGASGLDLDTFVIPRAHVTLLRLRADYSSCP